MKRRWLSIAVGISILFTSLCYGKIVDKIVAVVNGDVITLYDLKREMAQEELLSSSAPNEDNKLLSKVLSNMINNLLFKQEAQRLKISVSDFEVNKELEHILKSSNLTEQQLKAQLKKDGMTEKEFKDKIRDNIMINKLLSVMVRQKVVVTEEEIKDYYNSHRDNFTQPPMLHIIMYASSHPNPLKDLSASQIKNGEIPEEVSVNDMGFVEVSAMQKRWRDALLGLHNGMFSRIFKIGTRYVRFFIAGEKPRKVLPLKEVREKISRYLHRQKLKQVYEDYVKKLRSRAIIKIMLSENT